MRRPLSKVRVVRFTEIGIYKRNSSSKARNQILIHKIIFSITDAITTRTYTRNIRGEPSIMRGAHISPSGLTIKSYGSREIPNKFKTRMHFNWIAAMLLISPVMLMAPYNKRKLSFVKSSLTLQVQVSQLIITSLDQSISGRHRDIRKPKRHQLTDGLLRAIIKEGIIKTCRGSITNRTTVRVNIIEVTILRDQATYKVGEGHITIDKDLKATTIIHNTKRICRVQISTIIIHRTIDRRDTPQPPIEGTKRICQVPPNTIPRRRIILTDIVNKETTCPGSNISTIEETTTSKSLVLGAPTNIARAKGPSFKRVARDSSQPVTSLELRARSSLAPRSNRPRTSRFSKTGSPR